MNRQHSLQKNPGVAGDEDLPVVVSHFPAFGSEG